MPLLSFSDLYVTDQEQKRQKSLRDEEHSNFQYMDVLRVTFFVLLLLFPKKLNWF
jgi:hypothetical protein